MDMKDNLTRYLDEIRSFPLLTAEQEKDLAERWRIKRDRQALQMLIGSHLRLVVKHAKRYGGYGLALADLIAQGNLGIMQAAEKFDPDRGARFSTYATWWIRAAIQEYVMHARSLVKMGTTSDQKKLFFNLRRLKQQADVVEEIDLTPDQASAIACELDIDKQTVLDMNRRMSGPDLSLQTMVNSESEEDWQSRLVDSQKDPETHAIEWNLARHQRAMLDSALQDLTARERHILTSRRLEEDRPTLAELSDIYGISRERVRQIEQRAFEKVQKAMKRIAAASPTKNRRDPQQTAA
jgi:RNA polymerase sigma-32 factor